MLHDTDKLPGLKSLLEEILDSMSSKSLSYTLSNVTNSRPVFVLTTLEVLYIYCLSG